MADMLAFTGHIKGPNGLCRCGATSNTDQKEVVVVQTQISDIKNGDTSSIAVVCVVCGQKSPSLVSKEAWLAMNYGETRDVSHECTACGHNTSSTLIKKRAE